MLIQFWPIHLESPQQAGNMDRHEHGVHIDTTTIRGQNGQIQALKPTLVGIKLVQEICNFLWEATENIQRSKAHLSCADHILPHQGTPSNILTTPAPKIVRNFTPPHGPSPDVAADS